jgi:hypothetical protein
MTFKKDPPDLFLYVMFVTIVCRHDESNHLRRKWEVGWDSYLASAKVAIFDLVSGIIMVATFLLSVATCTWPVLR